MTQGRKTTLPAAQAQGPEFVGSTPEEMAEADLRMHAAISTYSEERDLANQLLGQAQMAFAVSKLTTVVGLTKLAHIKENKMYRAFAGKTIVGPDGQNRRLVGTWDEYCDLLGTSRQKVDEDLINLRAFGEDAMDSLTRIGAGYRELRQLRKLPEDQKTALIEVAKLGDKESFVELAEEIIAKNTKDKEVLAKRAEDAEADLEASRQRVALKESENEKLTGEVLKLKRRIESADPDQEGAELREAVGRFGYAAEVAIRGDLFRGFTALREHADKHNCTHEEFMSGCLAQIERALLELRNRFDVKAEPDGQEKPDWVRQFEAEDAAAIASAELSTGGGVEGGLPSVSEMIGED